MSCIVMCHIVYGDRNYGGYLSMDEWIGDVLQLQVPYSPTPHFIASKAPAGSVQELCCSQWRTWKTKHVW